MKLSLTKNSNCKYICIYYRLNKNNSEEEKWIELNIMIRYINDENLSDERFKSKITLIIKSSFYITGGTVYLWL